MWLWLWLLLLMVDDVGTVDSLLRLDVALKALPAAAGANVLFNFHPYMGPHQARLAPSGESSAILLTLPLPIIAIGIPTKGRRGGAAECDGLGDGNGLADALSPSLLMHPRKAEGGGAAE